MKEQIIKPITLTREVLQEIRPESIIYAEFADFGAMGASGTARIFVLRNDQLLFYLTGDTRNKEEDRDVLYAADKFLDGLKKSGVLDQVNGGAGNIAFKKHGIFFECDDDNCDFIYKKAGKKYLIPASVPGVYHSVINSFTSRKDKISALSDYYRKSQADFSSAESAFYESYLEQLKRISSGKGWFDFSPREYYETVKYIKYKNGEELITSWKRLETGEKLLQKYRLKYIVEKIGWNELNSIFMELVRNNSCGIFKAIEGALNEKVSDIYRRIDVREFSEFEEAELDQSSIDNFKYIFKEILSEPILVNFTASEREQISEDTLKQGGSGLRAGSYGFYIANYILNEDKYPYADLLPALAHVIKTLPFDDFNSTHTDDLFWLCGEAVNRSWQALTGTGLAEEKLRDFIYANYWPRIGSLWPIIHRDEYSFREEAGNKMFDDAAGFIMSLDDIAERNVEIKDYLEQGVLELEKIGILEENDNSDLLARRIFSYYFDKIADPRQKLEEILEKVDEYEWSDFLCNPKTAAEAEVWLKEIFNGSDEAKMTDQIRLSVLERLLMTSQGNNIGEYILTYICDHLEKLAEIIELESYEDIEEILMNLFVAASKGVIRKTELAELSRLKNGLLEYNCEREKLDLAEQYAKHQQETTDFQKNKLIKYEYN